MILALDLGLCMKIVELGVEGVGARGVQIWVFMRGIAEFSWPRFKQSEWDQDWLKVVDWVGCCCPDPISFR